MNPYVQQKIVLSHFAQGTAFISLDVSVRAAQISLQVWHRVRKIEPVWIVVQRSKNFKKCENND